MSDRLTKEQRHRCMTNIKSKNTKIEVTLRKALWAKGYRYYKNYDKIPGKPDIALTKYKIAVFCDSEFFHGKDWENSLKPQILRGSNPEFWIRKIERNMERDMEVCRYLEEDGWIVLRFWGKDIKKDAEKCVMIIETEIEKRKNSKSILRGRT
ncbi:MAG: very short patch repair endonuclease [Clostridiales bacterium]|nr:very short patch repair endonuclease [Clostridiales bacterium]